jgi:Zn-dependent peptidase ImmA (M78 family)
MSEAADLKAAAAVAPLVAADRLILARELKGWTQREVIERSTRGLSAAALSQLEHGHTRPAPRTLLALADVYGCPVDFFVERPGDSQPEGFFRSLRSTSARERKQYLARARLLHEFVYALEEHVELPDLNLPRYPRSNFRSIEDIAQRVRDDWNLPPGPIENVVRTLERHGIVVVRVSEFTNEVDAFSVRFYDRPVVVLGADKAVTARSRFDAAHELAHLVLHSDDDASTKDAESEAHAFAAAFLMPASEIRAQLPDRMDLKALGKLKTHWRVSIQALLMRAKTLGVMTPQRYTSAMKLISARGWRVREPGDELLGPLESPRMVRSALSLVNELGISTEQLCRERSLPLEEISAILDRTRDSRPRVDL